MKAFNVSPSYSKPNLGLIICSARFLSFYFEDFSDLKMNVKVEDSRVKTVFTSKFNQWRIFIKDRIDYMGQGVRKNANSWIAHEGWKG
jgi:hypothetical protein